MKKGISPLIAAVLLIAIAVGITAIIGPQLISFIKNQAEESVGKEQKQVKCSRAGLYIRSASYNGTYLKIQVSNPGDQELTDLRLDVIYSDQSSESYQFLGSSEILPPQGSRWYRSEATVQSNFEELIVLSETCPNTARDTILNSSVTWTN